MKCPYCEDTELVESLYYICPKCKIAMTALELAIAIRANEDAALMEKLTGQKVLKTQADRNDEIDILASYEKQRSAQRGCC